MKFNDLKIKTKILTGFGLVLLLVISLAVGVYTNTTKSIETFEWVLHTEGVIAEANLLGKLLVDMETGQRGFLITGDEKFLEPYTNGLSEFDNKLEKLTNTVSDNPKQVERLAKLHDMEEEWQFYVAEQEIQLRKNVEIGLASMDEIIEISREAKGKSLMDGMRGLIQEFTIMEDELNVIRKEDSQSASEFLITFTIVATLLSLLIGITISLYISSRISKPVQLVAERVEQLRSVCLTNLGKGLVALSNGDISQKVEYGTEPLNMQLHDEIGDIANSVDGMIKQAQEGIEEFENTRIKIGELISETETLIEAAKSGKLERRGNVDKFLGVYGELVKGINDTLDAVIQPVKEGSDVLQVMSSGDLTVRVTGNYKGDHQIIKKSINNLGQSLEQLINNVRESAEATSSSATEISSSTEQMAAGAQEQSSQSSEVATAIEELSTTILEMSTNANAAAVSSQHANDEATIGNDKIIEAKKGMERIVVSAQKTGKIIASLANRTDQIGEITQVIDEIADQTNLLALNAAIEAARAGEQGRGFAVVADEVRKLAERTTKATKEIADTVQAIQDEAKDANNSMNEAGESVGLGMKLNEEVEISLNTISRNADDVSNQINQLATASEQQSTTIEQVSRSVESINMVTNESAAGLQQVARATEDMNQLTEKMNDLMSQFKIDQTSSSNYLVTRSESFQEV